jgi:hypothetical protein
MFFLTPMFLRFPWGCKIQKIYMDSFISSLVYLQLHKLGVYSIHHVRRYVHSSHLGVHISNPYSSYTS